MLKATIIIMISIVISLPMHSEGQQMTADELYRKIKELEGIFPLPLPAVTIPVGTFYADTGRFVGHVSTITEKVLGPYADIYPGGKKGSQTLPRNPAPIYQGDIKIETMRYVENNFEKERMRRSYAPSINSPLAKLQFGVVGASSLTVTANNMSVTGGTSVTIDVWEVNNVAWKVTARGRSYSDSMEIRRPRIPAIGLGAFTIPALPMALIYEPPADQQRTSFARYSTTQYIGTTTKIAFGTEKATTRPVSPQHYSTANETQSDLRMIATALSTVALVIPIPYASQAVSALKVVADGLGKMSATQTTGNVEVHESALMIKDSVEKSYSTFPNDGGPGIGDMITYLKNVKFIWLAYNGQLKLTLLGYEGNAPKVIGVDFLRKNIQNKNMTGLDPSVGQALLNLDPFVGGGAQAALPSDRYNLDYTVDLRGTGGEETHKYVHEFSAVDMTMKKDFTTRVEDYRKGWLSFLGIGVTKDETTTSTSWHSSATETIKGEKTEVELSFRSALAEVYVAEVFFDRIFSTFAFRSVAPLPTPPVSGMAVGMDGKPLINKTVTLRIAGKSFVTKTDNQGRFAFHASTLPSAQASIIIDNKVYQELSVSPAKPIQNMQIQLRK